MVNLHNSKASADHGASVVVTECGIAASSMVKAFGVKDLVVQRAVVSAVNANTLGALFPVGVVPSFHESVVPALMGRHGQLRASRVLHAQAGHAQAPL
jgi:hypothetical protein